MRPRVKHAQLGLSLYLRGQTTFNRFSRELVVDVLTMVALKSIEFHVFISSNETRLLLTWSDWLPMITQTQLATIPVERCESHHGEVQDNTRIMWLVALPILLLLSIVGCGAHMVILMSECPSWEEKTVITMTVIKTRLVVCHVADTKGAEPAQMSWP